MKVLMAIQASLLLELWPLVNTILRSPLNRIVTFFTRNLGMLTLQFIFGVNLMIKLNIVLPLHDSMTGVAIFFSELTPVKVNVIFLMARNTRGYSSDVPRLSGSCSKLSPLLFMTLHTLDLGVRTR